MALVAGATLVGSTVACSDAAESEESVALSDVKQTLRMGDEGPEVRAVYDYLHTFGYFPNSELERQYPHWRPVVREAPENVDVFGPELEEAVLAYQGMMGLGKSGQVDQATLAAMSAPRCAHPENEHAGLDESEKFAFINANVWNKNVIKFRVTSTTADIPFSTVTSATRAAAFTWNNSSRLEVDSTSSNTFDIEVKFFSKGAPPAGWSDFSSANVLAYANKTRLAINDSFNWAFTAGGTNPHLESIFLHELGHSLGLHHSSISTSVVMYPSLSPGQVRSGLSLDDTLAIKVLYRDPWVSFGGTTTDIASGGTGRAAGSTWAILANGAVASWTGSTWQAVNQTGTSIAVDATGAPWVTKADGSMWMLPSGGVWTQILGSARDIGISEAGQVWAVGSVIDGNGNSPLFKRNGIFWDQSDEVGARVSVDSTGRVWIVKGDGTIRRRTTAAGFSGSWETLPGCATDIAGGPQRTVWATGLTTWAANCHPTSTVNRTAMLWNEQAAITSTPAARTWVTTNPAASGRRIAVNYNSAPLVSQASGVVLYGN